ncbi:Microtubules assembly and stabilization protein [Savitreella phatthalungensis]
MNISLTPTRSSNSTVSNDTDLDMPKPPVRKSRWFTQVKQREAKLAAAEDKAIAKEENQAQGKKSGSGFFGSALRRLSTGNKSDRRDSDASSRDSAGEGSIAPRMTLNKNQKRKRPDVPELQHTTLRRVCFQLDELVELRVYQQVEADEPVREPGVDDGQPGTTVKDMQTISPYADTTPLDRADLYLQCCRVYKTQPNDDIARQLRAKGPTGQAYEGPRQLVLQNMTLDWPGAVALADTLGLPITGKHLNRFAIRNCHLDDHIIQLLLSCLYTSARIEVLQIADCHGLGRAGMESVACFVCLSSQLLELKLAGPELSGYPIKLLTDILHNAPDNKIEAHELRELNLSGATISHDQVGQIVAALKRHPISSICLRNAQLDAESVSLLAELLPGEHGLKQLDVSGNYLGAGSLKPLVDALKPGIELISLQFVDCKIQIDTLKEILERLPDLPNFRALDITGHDIRPLVPTLCKILPRLKILRRLGLGHGQLGPNDVVVLCEALARTKITQLGLAGAEMDVSSGSALLALVQVSSTLISVDLEIPSQPVAEKLAVRILAKLLLNMERQEASVGLIDTDTYDNVKKQHEAMTSRQQATNVTRTTELEGGAAGVVSALGHILESLPDFENDPEGVPKELLDRARHIRASIEPALAEHHEEEMQRRRLQLVAETLDDVIMRVEAVYPEWKLPEPEPTPIDEDDVDSANHGAIFEHSGRKPAPGMPRHHADGVNKRSRQLEVEEGEMMKLSTQMSRRLSILRSASASATASPSQQPSPGELADAEEAKMLEDAQAMADGSALKARLLELQKNVFHRPAGNTVDESATPERTSTPNVSHTRPRPVI